AMSDSNRSLHYEFIIVGLPGLQEHYTTLFIFFLILFLATFLGNLLIVVLITMDQRLHMPMYFFLWNLSLLDILLTSTVIPKLLAVLLRHNNTISFSGCFLQMYFFISFATVEGFLVAVMAYDRYAAIVKPLHYNTIINTKVCITMTITVWVLGFLAPFSSVVLASIFPFCGSNIIVHIVCDYPTIMALACGDITAQVNFTLLFAMIAIYTPFLYVLWTYSRIVWSVMKLKTVESRKKAFSMCSSHMTLVFLYYVSAAMVYIGMRLESISPDGRIFIGTVYNFLTPLLNPIVYSLRNKKIKAAAQRYLRFQAPLMVRKLCSMYLRDSKVKEDASYCLTNFKNQVINADAPSVRCSGAPAVTQCLSAEHYTELFIIFLILFLATFFSNFFILVLVILDNRLHIPMYFFLFNLAALDILLIITIIPKLLSVLSGYDNTISLPSCFAQMYFYISLGAVEIFLVAAMAYDRYVAVVKPLHYNIIINPKICIEMAAIAWMFGFLAPFLSVVFASNLKFCGSHIVCDYPTVMSLTCGDVNDQENFSLVIAMIVIYIPFIFVLCSYCRIVWAVTKMKTIESRKKAFSMCSSHMTVVVLYYVSAAMVFIGLRAESIPHNVRIFFRAMCNCLTPLVNPVIYSLKNEKIKAAAQRYFRLNALFSHSAKNNNNIVQKRDAGTLAKIYKKITERCVKKEHANMKYIWQRVRNQKISTHKKQQFCQRALYELIANMVSQMASQIVRHSGGLPVLFITFLIVFLATFLGNLLIVVLISLDQQLHMPMYFFLWNLALLDILLSTSAIPMMLTGLLHHKIISFSDCFAQMYFITSFTATEGFLVAAMAYDRYVAVVKPLHYNTLINTKACITMISTAWVLGFLGPLLSVVLASTLPFFGSNFILHVVCDYHSVMSLVCGDVTAQINFALLIAMLSIYVPFLYVLWTYCRIIASVMKLKIMESRKKAFSMSSSHVTVVFLYYASGAVVYIGLRVERIPPDGCIFIGGLNYFLTPLLNPIIYSLRNEKIKAAAQRYFTVRPCQ
ncbi:OR6N1 protein, partial [Atractosteus spatula]|nr:OR6N1 protein [Atractosteus spatula]